MAKGKYAEWLEPEKLVIIEGWARDGLTKEQIAKNIGIHRDTLNEWEKRYPAISDSLKRGREVVDRQVENALLKRALGYEYTETKIEEEFGEITKKVTTTKQVVPDVAAQIFWLKNRKSEQWRDKQEYEDHSAIDRLDQILKEVRDNAIKQETE